MVHVILVVRLARSNNSKLAVRLRRRQKAHFARRVAGNHEQKKRAAAGSFDFDAEAFVGFLINQSVRLRRAGNVAIEPVRAFCGCVFDGIEKRAIVRSPSRAGDALDRFRKIPRRSINS